MSETEDASVSVYVADGNEAVLAELSAFVGRTPGLRVVGSSCDAATARSEIARLRPHVAVLDGRVGDVDGLELCRTLRRESPATACVMVIAGPGVGWGGAEAREAGAVTLVFKQLVDFGLTDAIFDAAGRARVDGDRLSRRSMR